MARAVAEAAGAELFTASEFSGAKADEFDSIAFGCLAMGAEALEETEFEPMFEGVKSHLSGKRVALFGSYGWGDGDWMQIWEDDCRAAGINLVHDSVISQRRARFSGACKMQGAGRGIVTDREYE